jgi:hypothetical protein
VDVDDAIGKAGDEGPAEQLHVAGEDDEVGAQPLDPVAHRGIPFFPIGVSVAGKDRTLDPRSHRTL